MKKVIVAILTLMLLATGCSAPAQQTPAETPKQETAAPVEKGPKPVVTMVMADGGTVKIELYPSFAPNTVNNFISLVNKKFYDGKIFHRVIKGFMIQGGDPEGTGVGGPGYSIKGEFSQNGFDNPLKHTAGVISMARAQEPDSAGSQFFIMHADTPALDGQYAAFGKVIEGMDVVNAIANVETGAEDRPVKEVVIKQMTVELNGYEAKEPVVVK